MRVLLTTWGWPSHMFPLVQLGWALQSAGHEVRVASQPVLAPVTSRAGLAAVEVGTDTNLTDTMMPLHKFLATAGRPVDVDELIELNGGQVVSLYRDLAANMLGDLCRFSEAWRPDLVVYDPTTFAGPVVAAARGVPAVRHIWGMDFTLCHHGFEADAVRPLFERVGVTPTDTLGAATVDPCPPSLQQDHPLRRLTMGYVPYNGPAELPRWLWDEPDRPRICVTGGTMVGRWDDSDTPFEEKVLDAVADLDVEVVVVNPVRDVPERPGLRVVPRIALHLLLPTCRLVVHPGGGGTVMTAIRSGTPQLLVPLLPDHIYNARRLVRRGAARLVYAATADAEQVRDAVTELLGSSGTAATVAELRAEMVAQPGASLVVDELCAIAERGV